MVNGQLDKRKNGLFTIEEIQDIWASRSWSGKKGGNPMIVRGGYNCRHQFSYVNPDWYEDDGEDSSTLLKDSKQDTKPTTSIFGDISDEEKTYLPLAFGTVATSFTRAISKIPKSPKMPKLRGNGAFYRPSTDEINLSDFDIENNLRARRVYAHEFGHKIDHNIGNIMLDKKNLAKKVIPNPDRVVYSTASFRKTLFDDVVDERKGKNRVQLSNSAQIEIMADRVNLKDNVKVGLTNYTDDLNILANKIQGKSFDQRLAIRTKYLDDIINEKSFPLNKNEIRELLREKGITYDPMKTETIDFVTSIKHKLVVSRYGKTLKLKLKNGETFKASTRDAGRGFDPMFGDYVGAISNNAIGFGHKLSYYDGFISTETIKRGYGKITYGHTTEAFANFTALSNTVNKEIYIKLMNYYAPQTTKVFTELYERSNLL